MQRKGGKAERTPKLSGQEEVDLCLPALQQQLTHASRALLVGVSARFACGGGAAAARGRNAKSASPRRVLTYDVEMYEVAHVRRGADLTLIDAGVAMLRILDLQRPLVRVRVMDGPEALVARVRVPAHGQQVDVAVPHPGDLQHIPIGYGETAKMCD